MLVEVAEGRALPAAESVIGERRRNRHIDADHPRLRPGCEVARGAAVAREDGGAIAIFMRVDEVERLFVAFRSDDAQHGAENLFPVDAHGRRHLVEEAAAHEEALLVALHPEIPPVDEKLRAFLDAKRDVISDALEMRSRDHGPEIGGRIGREADFQTFDARDEPVEEALRRFFPDGNRDRNRHAALARRAIARADQRIDRLIHVGVGHNHHVIFGRAETLRPLSPRAGARIDIFGDLARAHESDRLHIRIVEKRIDGFPVAIDDIEHARRQSRFHHQLGQAQRGRRVAFGRFQNEGVAAGDGGSRHPQGNHRREVEGRYSGGDAERLAHRIGVDARPGGIGEAAFEKMGRADAELDDFQPTLNVAAGVCNRLAVLPREPHCERVHLACDEFEEFHQDARAALRIGCCPRRLRGASILHGGANLGGRREGYAPCHGAGHRLVEIDAAPGAGDRSAANEMGKEVHASASRAAASRAQARAVGPHVFKPSVEDL